MKVEHIFHIGLPKTGTTWLQKYFFPLLDKKVISDEYLSGISYRMRLSTFIETYKLRYFIIYGLKWKYPNSKIILCIRDKDTWMKSLYSHHIRSNHGFKSYDFWLNNMFDTNLVDYATYIKVLNDLFGSENVFVYKYEDFKNNKNMVLKKMCDFIGCRMPDISSIGKINKGWYGWKLQLGRFKNGINAFGRVLLDRL